MHESILTALDAGATLVTAGRRLARHLAAEYGAAQEAAGRAVWETPDILPWEAWLERFWQESFGMLDGARPQALLTEFQELSLWEAVIREHGEGLLQTGAAARDAREAWLLLNDHDLPLPRAVEHPNEDAAAFIRWARAYERRIVAGPWRDRARLPEALRAAFAQQRIEAPRAVLLAGFDEYAPAQERLFATLRELGTPVEAVEPPSQIERVARVACLDRRAEIRAAAAFARARLEAGARRIGIVVPDLADQRSAVVRAFDEVLAPPVLLPGAGAVRPYNLSLGTPLAGEPLVHAALTALAAAAHPLPLARAGFLLRSPYFAGFTVEADARARLDAQLRRRGEDQLSVRSLVRHAQAGDTPRLAERLRAWGDALPPASLRRAPSVWSELFSTVLHTLGWPGEEEPDPAGREAMEAWRELLAEFAAQDLIGARLRYGEALALLRRMAIERVFQLQTRAVPVQVLGLHEASGLRFDALWVMGLDDERWPPAPRPNPFLPIELQRRHALPHASAARELDYARRLTGRFAASAREVVFSHPANEGDDRRRASPLILPYPELRPEDLPALLPAVAATIHGGRAVEAIRDERAPALPEGSSAGGGTRLIQDQAACPFRAFARQRLAALAPEDPEPGLDASTRGRLAHAALWAFWSAVGDSAALGRLVPEDLERQVDEAVNRAIEQLALERGATLSGRFRELEAGRLTRLLREWLALERERAPFRVVAAEQATAVTLGGLALTARMDRVDEIEGGARIVMDYKTGRVKSGGWAGERPDEPQLPLYAVALGAQRTVAAVAYAQLRPGELGFRGEGDRSGIAPGIGTVEEGAWPGRLAQWRATLERLAAEFRAGDARVDPKQYPKTCEHCGLDALCRVHERAVAPPEEERGEDDGG